MDRIELARFPSENWDDGSTIPELATAKALLERSLQTDHYNFTALYRLGLLEMLRR